MTRRSILIFAAAFLLTFAAVLAYQNFFKSSPLNVLLRCAENTNGKLTVTIGGEAKFFDAAEACRTGKIAVSDYRQKENVKIIFENKTGKRGEILSEYGADIQSDPQGFYVIVKITNEKPFLFNEKL